ncbi:hypothetical protein [Sulfurimonas sp.]|uniref:hypothetical protein n=1 Tax=Sulfurimonas sp. TaxID=2022749 RepID=UPI0035627625
MCDIIPAMKLRVLLSLLFVIATTLTAVHELEHVDNKHDSSKCLVCTVSHNFLSADIPTADFSLELDYTKEIISNFKVFVFKFTKTDNQSNAPPFIS